MSKADEDYLCKCLSESTPIESDQDKHCLFVIASASGVTGATHEICFTKNSMKQVLIGKSHQHGLNKHYLA
jgi:hypothetical protein